MTNLRDANIFQDFTVWIKSVGKIGESPGFQPPELKIKTEEFRGGGMDGVADMPMGLEKIEFDFDLHTWDADVFTTLGFGPGAMDVPIMFRGYLLSPSGQEKGVVISTLSLIKSIKPNKVEPGKKAELSVSCTAHWYQHSVDGQQIHFVSVFDKITKIGGVDKSTRARQILGFTY